MATKPDWKPWSVREQIVEDAASGLTIQFEVYPDGSPRLRIFGDCIPFGNREIVFDSNGEEAGAGTFTSGLCRPAWLDRVGE